MRSLVSYGFLAPPTVLITLCLLGGLIGIVWRRLGAILVLASSLGLFVAAAPAFSSYLSNQLESEIPDDIGFGNAEAIVVLGADVRAGDGAAPDRLGLLSLERLIFAAEAYRRFHLPVAVSGGQLAGTQTSVAELMKTALEESFAVPVAWSEDRSRTTYENALYSAGLLKAQHIRTVILITQAPVLPRAIWSFERMGLHAVPWPAPRTALAFDQVDDFLPSVSALEQSFYALHEIIGRLYYRLRY
jgi:uncharacterized SAM-binding protein YcdF (DUF218 family)